MKKRAFIILLIILSFVPITFAQIDAPIKKITYYAEQYEIGNINYAQLIVYTTSLSKEIAEEMGATAQGHDAVLKAEQLESALGKPAETTKWVWVENEEREKKLDEEAPAWRKIIFDGKKIQIWLNAWPNIILKEGEDLLFYRLNLDIRFKKPEEQIDINKKIEEMKSLAIKYSENPNNENLEALAKESVNAEQLFNSNFNQNPEKCEELMNEIFGAENRRDDQKTLVEEIEFYEGDDFGAVLRLEMCDECEWHWVNLHMEFKIHERFDYNYIGDIIGAKERFNSLTSEDFKKETIDLLDKIKAQVAERDFKAALENVHELRILTEAWNEKANNIWEEVEDKFKTDWESMTEEERRECGENYCWIKKEQEKRQAIKNLQDSNYEDRKRFYLDLFSSYEKKEFYYEQKQWEKRLVEEFKEFGEEICSNNLDDNNNGEVDCSDLQCGGKICGYDIITIEESNETREEKLELYCISNTCQAKEEIIKEKIAICGNHICEENEQETCAEDCTLCIEYKPLECAGNVIFSGEDENGCPLEPICLAEELSCNTDEDCIDPLCGDASCIKGVCQITELTECKEPECIEGQEKIQHCGSGEEIITEKCLQGLWKGTGVECEIPEIETEEKIEDVIGNECIVKADCGNENDVCSNGKCVTLPKTVDTGEELEETEEITEDEIEITPPEQNEIEGEDIGEESQESPELPQNIEPPTESPEQQNLEPEPIITGEVIFSFFRALANKIKITGFAVDETAEVIEATNDNTNEVNENEPKLPEEQQEPKEDEIITEEPKPEQQGENIVIEPSNDIPNEQREFKEEYNEQENVRNRETECNERCDRECYDREVRPCTEDCIWEECGDELECNIDEVRVKCENECKTGENLKSCKDECTNKCLAGKETWIEPEREEHKEEKFVFTIGGSCRNGQGKTEGFIWFGGWGENFNDFHLIKNKYYSYGGGDWCEEDLENLIKQRKELEKSLNEEFAYWFFEKYIANSADDWEKHISGLFELYWRDVDISRQMAERLQCLKKNELPEHNLINFKYNTDYGSVEFWEEIKTTKIHEDGEEIQIISPYMKTWLFPSREFFKAEMRKAMEKHKLPGEQEEERNTPTEDERREFLEDEGFIESIRDFNEKYGENLVVQFKDFDTNEVAFNVYIRLNENELMYFEPMLPSEIPAEDVRIEFDVNKLLDIIEYEETGRIELESPPWDKKPRVGFVKNVASGARMYFMFRSLMNSATVYPESAKTDAQFFIRNFFEIIMGDGEDRDDSSEEFDEEELPQDWENKELLTGEVIRI